MPAVTCTPVQLPAPIRPDLRHHYVVIVRRHRLIDHGFPLQIIPIVEIRDEQLPLLVEPSLIGVVQVMEGRRKGRGVITSV